jgi:putative selenate reductase molybdopterin-binding subunit
MQVHLTVNGSAHSLDVHPGELLRTALRRLRYYSVKFGDEHNLSGSDAVLLSMTPAEPHSYQLVNSGGLLAVTADGASIITAEGLSGPRDHDLHPLQEQFVACGAIQCGYCTPAQLLAAKKLLDANASPSDAEVREALAGVLCRCTGYLRPVEAVLRAAAQLRGEELPPYHVQIVDAPASGEWPTGEGAGDGDGRSDGSNDSGADGGADRGADGGLDTQTRTKTLPVKVAPPTTQVVNKSEPKVDANKLVKGRAVFADDMELPGMLYGGLLTSPHAHARIKQIDASKARALPGVHAVLTHLDVPRVVYASGGQSYPNPPPYDQVSLDNKVRHVGDRVAIAAAETREILQRALELIEVEYELLPAVFDPIAAMQEGAPVIHDQLDAVKIHDAGRNLVHHLYVNHGDVEAALARAAHVFESEYTVQQVQQTSIEPHVVLSWWDEDDRLVIRTSTQVPFHVRRMVAPLLGLPQRKVRVVKPRIGGGFGGKQEMLIEDLCAHLTLATGRPVRFEYQPRTGIHQFALAPPADSTLPLRRGCAGQAGRHGPARRRRHWGLWHARADGADGDRFPRSQHLLAAQCAL